MRNVKGNNGPLIWGISNYHQWDLSNCNDEYYICNPVTKTWIQLPERAEHVWHFISLAFDTFTKSCTLILGRNSTAETAGLARGGRRRRRRPTTNEGIVVQIYDSKIDNWAELNIPAEKSVRPHGEGTYSNGKFYWLNEVEDGECFSIVSFDGEDRQWKIIKGPQNIRAEYLLLYQIKFLGLLKVL